MWLLNHQFRKEKKMSDDDWQSGDSDNSRGSESDRYFKLRSCPLFDMDLRYQSMKIKYPSKFHQDVDKV